MFIIYDMGGSMGGAKLVITLPQFINFVYTYS
jgi:hypothetical protein